MKAEQANGFRWIGAAYASALVAAVFIGYLCAAGLVDVLRDERGLLLAAIGDLVATIVIFGFSFRFRNSSFYDAYWSIAPPLLFGFWLLWFDTGWNWRVWLVWLIVGYWSIRLTGNWAVTWQGLQHEDWRYDDLKNKLGSGYWPVSFLGIHLMPTVLVFLGCIPLYAVAANADAPWRLLDVLGLLVGVGAVALETVADRQLLDFRRNRENPTDHITTGVWSWCRHPNYLGELGFWFGCGCFGVAAFSQSWPFVGALGMLGLFAFISIPMIEKKLLTGKPGYEAYVSTTPRLMPRLMP